MPDVKRLVDKSAQAAYYVNMHYGLSDEQVSRLAEYYISNPAVSLQQLVTDSKKIVGMTVELPTLKAMSRRFRWGVQKRRNQMGKSGLPQSVGEEATDLRQLVYDRMMDTEEKDVSISELKDLINTWEKLQQVSPTTRSAKTSRQVQIEAAQRAQRKIDAFRESRNSDKA